MRKIAIGLICWLSWLPGRICAQGPAGAQGPMAAQGPAINPALLSRGWPASWIDCPGAAQREYGVYHFRKSFSLDRKPATFVVHVSADNRYRLLVNGHAVCSGPARGDPGHWNFETVDIAGWLEAGQNTVAALVWNMGVYAPVAQMSNRTAFLLQGDGAAEQIVNSDRSWKVIRDSSYSPCSTDNGARLHTYMVIGPGDDVNGTLCPWGWEQPGYDDGRWVAAESIAGAVPWGVGTDNLWTLVPRGIPLMEERLQRIPQVRRWDGVTPGGMARIRLRGRRGDTADIRMGQYSRGQSGLLALRRIRYHDRCHAVTRPP